MSLAIALSTSRSTIGGFVVIGICWGAIAASIPELKARIGASDALFGSLLLASATGLVTAMWLAPWADRRLGRFGLPLAAVGMACFFPLLGLATTPLAFAAVLAALGMSSGLTDVLANARVSELEARHRRSLMNLNHASFSFAYAASALVAGAGREAGLAPVLVLAGPAVVCLALATRLAIPPESPVDSRESGRSGTGSLIVWLCGAVVLAGFMAEAAVEAWSALHVERTLGGRAAEGALGPAMLGLTMGIGRLGGQIVAEKWRDSTVVVVAAALGAAGALIAAAAPTPGVAYVGFAVAGFGISVIGPLGLALAGRLVAPERRTAAIARAAVIGFSGFFFAPPLMGLVAETQGLRMSFVAVAVLLCATWPLVAALRRAAPAA